MTILSADSDTIIAQATPPGRGGVGILRLSGPRSLEFAQAVVRFTKSKSSKVTSTQEMTSDVKPQLKPRFAHFAQFFDKKNDLIDEGIVLYFPGPNSFTGEDVVELQGHGGPVVLDFLIQQFLDLGARIARPGEFSERAFLNDKLDLIQAEAIADLIDSSSTQAARSAVRSLSGEFSNQINQLLESLITLRLYIEAAIDFPEEEIDFLADSKVTKGLDEIVLRITSVLQTANQGALLQEGMRVVIAGRPNAGKSSLLNCLAGENRAIVTALAGTTRDVLREKINIDGMPLHIIDTAGLRTSPDEIEQEGIKRAWQEIELADQILLVVDASGDNIGKNVSMDNVQALWQEMVFSDKIWADKILKKIILIRNKIDLLKESPTEIENTDLTVICLSAKNNKGIDILRNHLKKIMGFKNLGQGQFSARRRHTDAIERALKFVKAGEEQLLNAGAGELLAEDLKQAQNCLSEITGEFTSDDLLGRIFSSFCIGK
ncbi:MAG: tRNA uridine-5-carboxymethylaminomethyl(34) synthesis GTPase MnmE [Pseudomonadales bacterium]|nr:tRNA uridine-5-carboxymethylaminomethyl(34) synthesis GTPase MnmE [Pseudomonadales bacterium]